MQNDITVNNARKTEKGPDQGGKSHAGRDEEGRNHGEGDPEAAARFNKAEQDFVKSPRGQDKIRHAGDVRPDEEAQLEEAERTTRSGAQAHNGGPKISNQ